MSNGSKFIVILLVGFVALVALEALRVKTGVDVIGTIKDMPFWAHYIG